MESKIVPLNLVPNHPKYLRLPSLSRSLVQSILPKTCQAMHTKPIIFSISVKPSSPEGAPKFSSRARRPIKQILNSIERPVFIRPNSPSYTYKKMFLSKEEQIHTKPKYYKCLKPSKETNEVKTSYYCELKERRDNKVFSTMSRLSPADKYERKGEEGKVMKNITEARPSQESSEESLKYFHIKQSSF